MNADPPPTANAPADFPVDDERFVRAKSLVAQAQVHAAETGALTATPRFSPLAALLAGHVLRDGEVVLLVLKPSLWFIVFQSILFAAAVAALVLGTHGLTDKLSSVHRVAFVEAAVFVAAGRVMWAVLQWMGRVYVLTDQRVIRMAGTFTVEIQDCPLRKIGRTNITANFRERLTRTGSIEIFARDSAKDFGAEGDASAGNWQTIARPAEVHERIVAAIRRAQS